MASGPALPTVYKAAVLKKHGSPLEFCDVKIRGCEFGEVLVKVVRSGVCHTDIHVQAGDWEVPSSLPIVPGHEGVGTVVRCGAGVSCLKLGDRVCLPWLREACGNCRECIDGAEAVCGSVVNGGYSADGAFAEYVYTPAKFATHVPVGVSDEQAAPIACAGVTVYKALMQSCVRPGQWVAITGAGGGLGHVAVQYAKAMGMRVVGIDAGAEKVQYLRQLGCELALDAPSCPKLIDEINAKTGGGVHGTVVLSPVPSAVGQAVRYTRRRGVIVPIALPPGDFSAPTFLVVVKAIRIQGSIVGSRQDLAEALDFAARGAIKCRIDVRPFSKVNEALDELRTGKVIGRLVLDMST